MQRVLLISDNAAHAAAVTMVVREDGRDLRIEPTLERGLLTAREWRPQLVMVDMGVGGAGITAGGLAALLRDPHVSDGVARIILAHREGLRLIGPGVELDDFLLTPVDPDELRLRVARALWERTGADDGARLRRGGLIIDLERYTVTIDGEPVDLTYKEYELLVFLASNPGKPFTREVLLNRVWGYDYYGGSRTVDVHIRRIRAKVERREEFIETVRNVGYRFIEQGGAPSSRED